MIRLLVATAILLLAATACASGGASNTPTATPTSTPEPVPPTPAPSPTATPSLLPNLSATPTPTPIPVEVDFTPNWTVGQRWNYEVFKTSERVVDGQLLSSTFSNAEISIEVLDNSSVGFVLGYTLVSADLPQSGDPQIDDIVRGLAELTLDLTFEVETTHEGVMTGLRNLDEMVPVVEEGIRQLTRLIPRTMEPEQAADFQARMQGILASFATEEGLIASGLPDMTVFTLPFGWVLETGAEFTFDDLLPNPFGGPPIPSTAFLLATDRDPGDAEYMLDWLQGFEGELAEQAMLEGMIALAEQVGGPRPTIDAVRGLSREDSGTFRIDTETGTLKELFFVTTVSSPAGGAVESRTETTEFILLP